MKQSLCFKAIPIGYKEKQKVAFLWLEFSGIQNYIFNEMSIKTTVKDIKNRSFCVENLTFQIRHVIEKYFSKYCPYSLSKASGKLEYIFSSKIHIKELVSFLNSLQKEFFVLMKGEIEFFYGYSKGILTTKAIDSTALETAIKMASDSKYHCENMIHFESKNYVLNHYFKEEIQEIEEISLQNMVGIKFDLDNLGQYFKSIKTLDENLTVSSELDGIMKNSVNEINNVILVYVGGDDLFILTPLSSIFTTILKVKNRIINGIMKSKNIHLCNSPGISCGAYLQRGIDDLKNQKHYYIINLFNSCEKQLKKAKEVKNRLVYNDEPLEWEELEKIVKISQAKVSDIDFINIKLLKGRI